MSEHPPSQRRSSLARETEIRQWPGVAAPCAQVGNAAFLEALRSRVVFLDDFPAAVNAVSVYGSLPAWHLFPRFQLWFGDIHERFITLPVSSRMMSDSRVIGSPSFQASNFSLGGSCNSKLESASSRRDDRLPGAHHGQPRYSCVVRDLTDAAAL